MLRTIGSCSNCGGAVQIPDEWMYTVPPIPTCSSCGARAKQAHGPVIPMVPGPQQRIGIEIRPYTPTWTGDSFPYDPTGGPAI